MGIFTVDSYVHGDDSAGGVKRWFGVLSDRTLTQRVSDIGADKALLEIYAEETISASLDIPANITVIMKPGSKLTISGDGTELWIAKCICEGYEHFSIGEGSWLLFGSMFTSHLVKQFAGDGMGNVRFGLGAQLISETARQFTATGSWTLPEGFAIADGALTADGTALTHAYYPITMTAGWGETFWMVSKVSAYTSGSIIYKAGNTGCTAITATGTYEDIVSGANTNPFYIWYDWAGSLAYVSCRKVYGGGVSAIRPEWWGAVADALTDCTAAINYAIKAATGGGRGTSYKSICNLVKLEQGYYLVKGLITLLPWVTLKGAGFGSSLLVHRTLFVGDTVLRIGGPTDDGTSLDGAYSFYAAGDRGRHLLMEDLQISASGSAYASLYLLHIANHFNSCDIHRVRFVGNDDVDHPVYALYYVGNSASINSSRILGCNVKDCYVPAGNGAFNFIHSADCQNFVIGDCNFNNNGCSLKLGGSNNLVRDNNFEGKPAKYLRVMYRYDSDGLGAMVGTLNTSILTTHITKGNPTVFGYTHGLDGNQTVLLTGIDQDADWITMNGLHKVTIISSVSFSIDFDSSTFADWNDTCNMEWTGGHIFRADIYGNRQILQNNYFDGYGMSARAAINATVGGAVCSLISYENMGINEAERSAEFVTTGTAQVFREYTGIYDGSNKNKIVFDTQDLRAVLLEGNYVWVYQVNGTIIYGYIKCKIMSVAYADGDTTITLSDSIVRSDTTITVSMEPTAWDTNKLIQWRGAVLTLPSGSL